jgi:hypothetical protein
MPEYADKDGHPLTREQWMRLSADERYARVAATCLTSASTTDAYEVSTLWFGINYGALGETLMYETIVFAPDGDILALHRYSTEPAARAGHDRAVADTAALLTDPVALALAWNDAVRVWTPVTL